MSIAEYMTIIISPDAYLHVLTGQLYGTALNCTACTALHFSVLCIEFVLFSTVLYIILYCFHALIIL